MSESTLNDTFYVIGYGEKDKLGVEKFYSVPAPDPKQPWVDSFLRASKFPNLEDALKLCEELNGPLRQFITQNHTHMYKLYRVDVLIDPDSHPDMIITPLWNWTNISVWWNQAKETHHE